MLVLVCVCVCVCVCEERMCMFHHPSHHHLPANTYHPISTSAMGGSTGKGSVMINRTYQSWAWRPGNKAKIPLNRVTEATLV